MTRGRWTVRHVRADEDRRLRALRLRSLQADPDAFGSTYARDAALPDDEWARRAAASAEGVTQRTFIVCEGEEWLGLALARAGDDSPGGDSPGDAVLNAMWVDPRGRGRGAAGLLCEACAEWAAARGFTAIALRVVTGNAPARRVYERAGFLACGETTWERPDGTLLDELVMRRALPG